MYKEIGVFEYANEALTKMKPGIFLNTKKGNTINTMIIGWGGITVIWGRPIFLVLVRDSRATYDLIESSNEFTISVPLKKDFLREIAICGTKSLRDMDKFKECNFTPIKGRKIETPIISNMELHYECKVIYKQTLDQSVVPDIVKSRYYNQSANHTVYYGEILDQYLYEEE
ncbi:MAG: flavin reductase [Candidatus Izemoplasmatales bacterium]|nr:flavin reductase [Candidatus Izemoplasmatales bacterium]MDY0140056.1 flavin reductase [Candidatus Izemoplasmatales bacterium]